MMGLTGYRFRISHISVRFVNVVFRPIMARSGAEILKAEFKNMNSGTPPSLIGTTSNSLSMDSESNSISRPSASSGKISP